MILPVTVYGDPVLLKKATLIDKAYPNLSQLIENMFETMYKASGVGLAAPQVGLSIRLFVIDAKPFAEDEKQTADADKISSFKKVFINPEIIEESGTKWPFTEGCLSIPDIREQVSRYSNIKIRYCDENWTEHTEDYDGILARIIQHEYDHIEGKLFTDYLSPLKKALLKNRLQNITKGNIHTDYKIKRPTLIKGRR